MRAHAKKWKPLALGTAAVLAGLITLAIIALGISEELDSCPDFAPKGYYERLLIDYKVSVFPLGAYCSYEVIRLDGSVSPAGSHRSGPEVSLRASLPAAATVALAFAARTAHRKMKQNV